MGLALDSLCNDAKAERVSHCDDGGGDRGIVGLDRDLPDERAVDLEGVQRKMLEVAEGGVAGTKIIHREVQAHGAEPVQRLGDLAVMVDENALGELQTQVAGLQPTNLEGATNCVG